MAYGLKYIFRAETIKYKDDIKIYILEKDYTGSSENKFLGGGGVTLTKDNAGVICGTSLSFFIQADTDFEYLNFFETDPREYLVQLLKNDVIIWQGYLIGDEYREAFKDPPYDVAITATDGLGLLKNETYAPIATPTTKTTRIDVIRTILNNTGLDQTITLAYDAPTTGGTHLFGVSIADDYYSGWTCYEVLEKMIPPDATITQHAAGWLIRRNEQDSEATPKIYDYVEGAGYMVWNGTGETAQALAPIGAGDLYPIGEAELNMRHAWASVELFSEHGRRPSFLYNHDFVDGLEYWTEGPTTGYVTTWASESGSYVKITGNHTPDGDGVPEVYVKQSFPYTSVTGQDFCIDFQFCPNGYLSIGGGKKAVNIVIQGRVKITDGVDSYYLDGEKGWTTDNKDFERKVLSNIGPLSWQSMRILANRPPISGTMTVYLYGSNNTENMAVANPEMHFTDIKVYPVFDNNYPDSYRYEIKLKENATERETVTILPTTAPDLANFDRLFYNGQTVGGSRADSFVSGGNTYTFVNLILNSMEFLHGTTRQLLQGYFRGKGLTLNSVISCAAAGGRKYYVESGAWEVLNDKFNLNLLEIPGTASGSSWAMGTSDFSASAELSNNVTRGGGSSETISGGGSAGGGSWLEQYFELVNPGTSGEYIRALRDFASTGEITAYNVTDTTGTGSIWDAMPIATTGVLGGVKVDGVTIHVNESGVLSATSTGGGGVADHGALSGLADDDHTQYITTSRGDVRYQRLNDDLTAILTMLGSGAYTGGLLLFNGTDWSLDDTFLDMDTALSAFQRKDADLTAIANIPETLGYLRKTGANTWAVVNSTFLTSESDPVFAAASGMFSTTGHNHSGTYEPAISKSAGYLTWNGSAFVWKNETYSLSSHNHSGTYEPVFSKNTAFNKNFGTNAGEVCQGNDARLSDARTPLSHTHGSITNDGKIGVVSGKPIITTTAGALTAGSFGTSAGTFAQGNDSRFHSHDNASNLAEIDQDLGTGDDVHFLSADVSSLEVDQIIDGIFQTGYGANLLKYSSVFENEVWEKTNCTAFDNNENNPFGGDTSKAAYLMIDSSSPVLQQSIANTATGNHTFSFWIKSAGSSDTIYMKAYSNTQSVAGTAVAITTAWQRVSVTTNFNVAHATKYVRIDLGTQDVIIWGAQLESGTSAKRYINTTAAGSSETGIHAYGDIRISGSLVASDEVTAHSDARLKHDILRTSPVLDRVRQVEVVDYRMNGDKTGRVRTGVIAQQILPLFPQMVEGNENDYYSVNYPKLAAVAIKAIQELSEKVERLEKALRENGITQY